MQLQPFSVNDGEGIRTNIFIAGCPLRCRWCSNPEGFEQKEAIGWYSRRCIGCGACFAVCPQGIGIDMNAPVDVQQDTDLYVETGGRQDKTDKHMPSVIQNDGLFAAGTSGDRITGHDKCIACGACVKACPENARTRMVTLMDADDIIQEIHKHRLFYSYSGGGVTFSGGEATSQPEFLDYLSGELYDMGYSLDLESCGYFDFDRVRSSLERMDLIFMDLKHMDSEAHRRYTGVGNERILDNIKRLGSLNNGNGPEIVIRIPVIGSVNNSEDNIAASAAYVHEHLPQARMELLPYHRLGKIKYEAIGRPFEQDDFYTPDAEEMKKLRRIVAEHGVQLADFR